MEVEPALTLNVPLMHEVHAFAVAYEPVHVPGGQIEHSVDAGPLKLPGAHGPLHVKLVRAVSLPMYPAGHSTGVVVPAGQ